MRLIRRSSIVWSWSFALVLFVLETNGALAGPFSQDEFPNYFISARYRQLPPDQIPSEEVARQRQLVEKALGSVFSRLTIPISNLDGSITNVRYFDYLRQALGEGASTSDIMASGGVIRSALGYLYAEITRGLEANPRLTPNDILETIIATQHNISGLEVRGVGSDWDILLRGKGPDHDQAIERIKQITNSVETSLGLSHERNNAFKQALLFVADVKDYDTQTTRSTREGGSTLDFLAYDVAKRKIVEPGSHPGIVDDFIRGFYSYVKALPGYAPENPARQVVRGPRSLLELPFLRLKNDSVLRAELLEFQAQLESNPRMDLSKAVEQFNKMVRNARFSGANNRFYRARPGSVEALVLDLARTIHRISYRVVLPEFVDRTPLHARIAYRHELKGMPQELLMDMATFLTQHTDNGHVYHGTSSIENSLAILRQGLFVSSTTQGGSAKGRGGYCSRYKTIARGFAGSEGVVFTLPVRRDSRVNILNWPRAENHPWMKLRIQEARKVNRDIFEYLAREYGIDIVVNTFVLIQNTEALEFPLDVKDFSVQQLLQTMSAQLLDPRLDPLYRFSRLDVYQKLFVYGQALGVKGLPEPIQFRSKLILELAKTTGSQDVARAEMATRFLLEVGHDEALFLQNVRKNILTYPQFLDVLPEFIQAARTGSRISAKQKENLGTLFRDVLMRDPVVLQRIKAGMILVELGVSTPQDRVALITAIKTSMPQNRHAQDYGEQLHFSHYRARALSHLANIGLDSQAQANEVLAVLKHAVSEKEYESVISALEHSTFSRAEWIRAAEQELRLAHQELLEDISSEKGYADSIHQKIVSIIERRGLNSPEIETTLISMFRNPKMPQEVRGAAIMALGSNRASGVVPLSEAGLLDHSRYVRMVCGIALSRARPLTVGEYDGLAKVISELTKNREPLYDTGDMLKLLVLELLRRPESFKNPVLMNAIRTGINNSSLNLVTHQMTLTLFEHGSDEIRAECFNKMIWNQAFSHDPEIVSQTTAVLNRVRPEEYRKSMIEQLEEVKTPWALAKLEELRQVQVPAQAVLQEHATGGAGDANCLRKAILGLIKK